MSGYPKSYFYTLELCNADWTPANLNVFDYIKGFTQNRLTQYRISAIAANRYVHYQALLPERNCVPTRSGNYLLKVYLDGELESEGRMAQLLVSIKDPLSLTKENEGKPPLLIGSYVRAEIRGRMIPSVVSLKREYLRDGDNIWVYTDKDTLSIHPVDIIVREQDTVLIADGLEEGTRVITTDLAGAVEEMPLRLRQP